MPTIPTGRNLTASSVDILNAIRNSATANYRDYIPVADQSTDSIRAIGAVIMDYPALQNEFLNALVNRIGRVLLENKMFTNPWSVFKRGTLDFGETIEEVFVNIAKPFTYDQGRSESEVFKREIPDVRAAFHILNYQKFYKATVDQPRLQRAFLSWDGVNDLIAYIVNSMYTGANYDEFLTMKYLLARHILNGELHAVQIPSVSTANMRGIVGEIKGISNEMVFPTTKYNLAGVMNFSEKKDQYIIVNSKFDAVMDVEVLASAFNMDKADFMGHRVLIDSFGSLDTDRLAELFDGDTAYVPLTDAELTALDAVPAVLVDEKWFMIFDNLIQFTEQFNGEGLYWNYWYHAWKTFSVSPFANSAVFVPGEPAITSVTVTPASATVQKGQGILLNTDVVTTNFASKSVNWTLNTPADGISITPLGYVKVASDYAGPSTVIATATSTVNESATDTCTITIA